MIFIMYVFKVFKTCSRNRPWPYLWRRRPDRSLHRRSANRTRPHWARSRLQDNIHVDPKTHKWEEIVWCRVTFGNLCTFLVEGSVELMILAFQLMDFFVEFGLQLRSFQLDLFQSLETLFHWTRQGLEVEIVLLHKNVFKKTIGTLQYIRIPKWC